MLSSHGETTVIPNLIYDKGINKTGSGYALEGPLNERFNSYGWTTTNFI